MRKITKIAIIVLMIFGSFSTTAFANSNLNAGFVTGIWYSRLPFFANKPVKIFVGVQNQSNLDITGEVQFFNNDKPIGKKIVTVDKGRFTEVWIEHTFTYGTAKISASLIDTKAGGAGVTPANTTLLKRYLPDEHFVDKDTDDDGIGDREDEDIDGDGVSNTDEKKKGTDPTKKDTDGDGIDDKDDPYPLVANVKEQPANNNSISDRLTTSTNSLASVVERGLNFGQGLSVKAQPAADKAIDYFENRKKNLFDLSISSTKSEKPIKVYWTKFKLLLYSFIIFLIKNWFFVFLIILLIFILKLGRRWIKR